MAAFADTSVDAVISTMALHHLPDLSSLACTYNEVARVLKPGGGIYMVDFGHLKSQRSINYFAHQYANCQPELFTRDYLNSLHAAFYFEDIRQAAQPLLSRAKLYSTFLLPFMVALKSPKCRDYDVAMSSKFDSMKKSLPIWQQKDFGDLTALFRRGGLACGLLGQSD